MEHYVGLDVSLKLTAICIVDEERSKGKECFFRSGGDRDIHQIACAVCRTDWARDGRNN